MVSRGLDAKLATDLLLKIFREVVFAQEIHFFIVSRYKSLKPYFFLNENWLFCPGVCGSLK